MSRLLTMMIRLYQAWSARRVPVCRFHPSCSEYAIDALDAHGVRRGLWLSIRRVCRCRPGGGFGFDPVPMSDPSLSLPRS